LAGQLATVTTPENVLAARVKDNLITLIQILVCKHMKNCVFLLLIAALVVSCTKENVFVSAELKQNFFFPPSSYWVYQDSISGSVDSFVVTRYEKVMSNGTVENEEAITLHFNRYRNGLLSDTSNNWWTLGAGVSVSYFVSSTLGRIGFYFWYPYESLPSGMNSDSSRYSITSLPYRNVNNHSYYPTAEADVTNNTGSVTDKFYVTAKVGLIQMIIDHPSQQENWQLLRYYIAQ